MSLFKSLLEKFQIKPAKSKEENKKLYYGALLKAVEDGILTSDEIEELDGLRAELGLKEEDVAGMRVKAFQVAVNCATADGLVTPKEEKDLQKIRAYLGVGDSEVARNRGTLNKMRVLYEVQKGNVPIEEIPGLGLQKGETAHINQPGIYLTPDGGTPLATGQVFTKGKPYRMGAGRPGPMPEIGLTQVGQGTLTVTSQRVMFNAARDSFFLRYDKIVSITLHTDGFGIAPEGGGIRYIRLENKKDMEIIAAIMSKYLNAADAPPA